MKNVAEVD